jgi:hypothetical protein
MPASQISLQTNLRISIKFSSLFEVSISIYLRNLISVCIGRWKDSMNMDVNIWCESVNWI